MSLDQELIIWDEFSLNLVLVDVKESHAATGTSISVACKRNAALKELFDLCQGHIGLVI